jgi:hypothetical protein
MINKKLLKCAENGIELCVIDTSSCKHLTEKTKIKYYSIVKNIVDLNRFRANKVDAEEGLEPSRHGGGRL